MRTDFSINVDGFEDLKKLLEENQKLVEQLYDNMVCIDGVCLKINGKINQLPADTNTKEICEN